MSGKLKISVKSLWTIVIEMLHYFALKKIIAQYATQIANDA